MAPYSELERWIDALRGRLERGDLAGLAPFDIGDGTLHLPGEQTIRIMLADLADLDNPAGSTTSSRAWREEQRHQLLGDFRRLRELLG